MKFIDIGANLVDGMYQGLYNDKLYHTPDLENVLERAWAGGVEKIIITGGSLTESEEALRLALTDDRLYCTVGCHPTRCGEFEAFKDGPAAYLERLEELIQRGKEKGKVVAVGECGLDYDRLHFCDADTQRRFFEAQIQLAEKSGLPMFLHLRAAATDFLEIMARNRSRVSGGVIHSFTGTAEEAQGVLALGESYYIGLNGCSLRSEESLQVAAALPAERLMLETDCPWCEIRNTHAGASYVTTQVNAQDRKKHNPALQVRSRNEPVNIRRVFEVLAGHRRSEDPEALAQQLYDNTERLFFVAKQ